MTPAPNSSEQEALLFPIGVIFDLDGTLLDSEKTHLRLYQATAKEVVVKITEEEYDQKYRGKTDEAIIQEIASAANQSNRIDELVQKKQEKFLRLLESGSIGPMPGAIDFLRCLAEDHFKLAVVTSATRDELDAALKVLEISGRFHVLITAESVKRGKPAPDAYLKAAELLGLKPSECLVYEDAVPGITGARAAGMFAVGIGQDDIALKDAGAFLVERDFCNHRLPELPA